MRKADMPTQTFTQEILAAAIVGYEAQKRNIDVKIVEIRAMISGGGTEATATAERIPRKHKVSAAARRRMAIAQRKRWAKAKKSTEPPPQEAPKPKRKLSAAGRKRIIDATEKRWAAVKAAKAQQEKAAAKKKAAKKAPIKVAKKTAPPVVPAVEQPTAQ